MNKQNKEKLYIFDYNLIFINVLSVVILIITGYFTWCLIRLKGLDIRGFIDDLKVFNLFWYLLIMVAWLVTHEIIHGLFYIINGANKENITYGVALEKGIFYCKCGEFINKKNIILSVIAPFVIIGVITYVIGFVINSWLLIFLSVINIVGAAGDLAMFTFFLKRDKNLKFKELGDSTRFCLQTKEDLTKKKFISVKLKKIVEDEREILEEKQQLINISKDSKYILIFFGGLIALNLLLSLILMFID